MSEQKTVTCPQCGIKNNVKPHKSGQYPICGNCKGPLHWAIINDERLERETLHQTIFQNPIERRRLERERLEREGDERFYLIATDEANNADRRDSALWAKAMALSMGDSEKAIYSYINLRVEQLTPATTENSQKLKGQKKETIEKVGLGLGIASVFLAEFGMISLSAMIVNLIALGKNNKSTYAWIGLILGGIFFLVSLHLNGHF